MAVKAENPVVGGTVLRRAAIQSPNYVTGSAGWAIKQDGSAEFNNVTIRGGQIVGGTALYYSGTPAANNLVASISAAAGTDAFGNAYFAGFTEYGKSGLTYYAVNIATGTGSGDTFGGTVQAFTGADMTAWTGQATLALAGSSAAELTCSQLHIRPPGAGAGLITVGNPATPAINETWHDMTLLNSWSLGASGYAQYKLEINNRVSVRGANVIPGTVTGGTSIWTPPANYAPVTTQRVDMVIEVSTGAAGVDTPRFDAAAGGFDVFNIPASTTRVGFNGSYALD